MVVTVAAEGARVGRRLETACVVAFSVRGEAVDPAVDTYTSGCDVTVGAEGKFHVRWTSTPQLLPFRKEPIRGYVADVERVTAMRAAAATPIREGETEIPMGAFTSGGDTLVRLGCHFEE
jgi:hypothetical protein